MWFIELGGALTWLRLTWICFLAGYAADDLSSPLGWGAPNHILRNLFSVDAQALCQLNELIVLHFCILWNFQRSLYLLWCQFLTVAVFTLNYCLLSIAEAIGLNR